MIYHNQAQYYAALQQSHKGEVDCRPFIDYMLDVIENAMYQYVDMAAKSLVDEKEGVKTYNVNLFGGLNGGLFGGLNETQQEIIALIKRTPNIKIFEIAQARLKPVRTVENNLSQLKEKGIITRVGSKKTGYWKIKLPSSSDEGFTVD
jgi:predicted HTH transcriptional regulator